MSSVPDRGKELTLDDVFDQINRDMAAQNRDCAKWHAFKRDLNLQPESANKKRISKNAENMIYHDYESPLALPKVLLHLDLLEAGYAEMAGKLKRGDYDF